MNSDVAMFAQVMVVIVSSIGGLVVIALGGRVLWRLGSRKAPPSLPPAGTIDETHIERLEQAIDAIAIEVERISEAQRYTVGLLSDRKGDRVLPAGEPRDARN